MSTRWYLECASHVPAIQSDEVSQHTDYRIERIKTFWANRKEIRELKTRAEAIDFELWYEFDDWMFNEAVRFILEHINCKVILRDEYGATIQIEEDS